VDHGKRDVHLRESMTKTGAVSPSFFLRIARRVSIVGPAAGS
jgi:hypothetical protein